MAFDPIRDVFTLGAGAVSTVYNDAKDLANKVADLPRDIAQDLTIPLIIGGSIVLIILLTK